MQWDFDVNSKHAASGHLASFRAPDAHGVVPTSRDNFAAVGQYGKSADGFGVSLENFEHLQRPFGLGLEQDKEEEIDFVSEHVLCELNVMGSTTDANQVKSNSKHPHRGTCNEACTWPPCQMRTSPS